MKTFTLKQRIEPKDIGLALKIISLLLLLWQVAPIVIQYLNPTAGLVDAGIWQLVLMAFCCWIGLLLISAFIAQYLYYKFILLLTQGIHLPLNSSSWQHLVLYWASFALLALSATGCLIAIC